MRPTNRSRAIVVPLINVGTGLVANFPDQNDLRSAMVLGVETFTSAEQLTSRDGRSVVSPADALNLAVTLVDSSDQKVMDVPYQAFNTILNSGQVRTYRDLVLTWEQCTLRNVAPLSTDTSSALVMVSYALAGDVIDASGTVYRPSKV